MYSFYLVANAHLALRIAGIPIELIYAMCSSISFISLDAIVKIVKRVSTKLLHIFRDHLMSVWGGGGRLYGSL